MAVSNRSQFEFIKSVFSLKELPSDGLSEICISGRSNVGKSSMINRLAGMKKLAKISRKPGKTQSLNYFNVGKVFYLVDLPGYGYAKVPKTIRNFFAKLVNPYLTSRQELKGIIQLIDSRHGPVSGDHSMIEWLKDWDGRTLFVFTKVDKLTASQRAIMKKKYEKEFGSGNCVMFSALKGMGVDEVWSWINSTLNKNK